MNRRHFLAVAATASLAGCVGQGDSPDRSRLALTVQNDRSEPVTVQVTVVDDEGETYEDGTTQVDSGVAREFEVVGGTTGRHEATVAGDEWRGQVAWHADTCARFDGTVRVSAGGVDVASECLESR